MNREKLDVDFPTELVREGEVQILVPKLSAFVKKLGDYAPSKAPVFYNPKMELNRDIAVLATQAYQRTVNREISICEPLASCGVRGVRLAKEVKGVKKVVINDINAKAYQLAKHNVQINGLKKRVTVKNMDANLLLASHGAPHKRFDVIDIDPFGSPVPFMDSAVRAIRDGGLIALTATDMAPLCGVHPKACMRKYGGNPLRTEYCHELAVRLLIGCLAMTAAKYEMGIRVLFSYSTYHYVRVYAALKHGAKMADESIKSMGYVLHCFECFHRETINKPFLEGYGGKCPKCGSKMGFAGPLWLKEIFDKRFCAEMRKEFGNKTFRNIYGIHKMLALIGNEAEFDTLVTYYVVDDVCDKLGLPTVSSEKVCEALKNEGFKAIRTHFNSRGIKTDAPAEKVMQILRGLCTKNDKF